jgi:hypothetical protein
MGTDGLQVMYDEGEQMAPRLDLAGVRAEMRLRELPQRGWHPSVRLKPRNHHRQWRNSHD